MALNSEISSLQKIIDEQNHKILTYQSKLRDIIQAYKDLKNEKNALESSMSALHSGQVSSNHNDSGAVEDKMCDISSAKDVNSETELKKQITTLTESLIAMTTQKNKSDATYIAEKKILKQDFEERSLFFQEEIISLKENMMTITKELELYKKRLLDQQSEHEKESKNHAIMLRELQTIINTEKTAKENLESQLEEILLQVDSKMTELQKKVDFYEKEEFKHENEIKNISRELKNSTLLLNESQLEVIDLKRELINTRQLEATMCLDLNKEEKLKQLTDSNDRSQQRISDLEQEIRQLSMVVGEAQRNKAADFKSIQNLKDKCIQMQQENLELSSLISTQCKVTDTDLNVPELIEKIRIYLDLLKAKNYDLNLINDSIDSLSNLHTKCHQKYDQLNEEFEKYKLRAQSVLKNKSKDLPMSSDRELLSLHNQVSEYKERSLTLRRLLEEKDAEIKKKEQILKSAAEATSLKLLKDMEKLEVVHLNKVQEVEKELRLMRERTVALLEEKEEEVQQMKMASNLRNHIDATDGFLTNETTGPQTSTSGLVDDLLKTRNFSTSPELLHHKEEKYRLNLELANLKKQKQQLQTEVRELQRSLVMRENELIEKIKSLEESLGKVKRDARREDANLEYLKNVILRYVSNDSDSDGRKRMLNAIATILEFSPTERTLVFKKDKKYW